MYPNTPGLSEAQAAYDHQLPPEGGCETCGEPLNGADGRFCPEHDPELDREDARTYSSCNVHPVFQPLLNFLRGKR